MQFYSILTLTRAASGAIAAHRFVTLAGTQAGAGANTLGVARTAAVDGELIPVDVLGTTIVEAGAAVAVNASLMSNTEGKAVTQTAGNPVIAVALEAASADGDLIEVLLISNAATA